MIHRHLLNKSDAGTPSTYSPRVRKERHDYKRDNILLIVAIHDHCRNFCTHRRLDGMCAMFDKCPLNKHVTDINHDNRAIAPKPENTL
jgi:hypothetical protein